MKNYNSHPASNLVSRPLVSTVIPADQASDLRLLSTGETDFADTVLRFFLMLSLLASLVLCGLQPSHVASRTHASAAPVAPTQSHMITLAPTVASISFR